MTGRSRRDLSQQMRQAAARQTPPAAPAAAPRVKPVRLSLDLTPAAYRELQRFCTATAVATERPRVAGAEVLRALLAELVEDETLAGRVQARLAQRVDT